MNRVEAWAFHVANVSVAVTGLFYAWTVYFATNDDPYALSHPWQAPFQHAHVIVAPILVFCVGVLWRSHAAERLRSNVRDRRFSGWSLLASFAPAAMSGYALQTATDDTWREVWVFVHLVASTAWMVGSIVHVALRFRAVRRGRLDARSLAGQTVSMSSSTRG